MILVGAFHVLTDRAPIPADALGPALQGIPEVTDFRNIRTRGSRDAGPCACGPTSSAACARRDACGGDRSRSQARSSDSRARSRSQTRCSASPCGET